MSLVSCAHCGLPVLAGREAAGLVFCCYGCALVSRIVGDRDRQGPRAWIILRLSVGALLAMNVMMLAMLLYTGGVEAAAVPLLRWAMLALAAPALAILGYPFLAGAAAEIRRRQLSLDSLIALGSFTAFGVSAVNTIRGAGHVYFDTATMLPVLVTFGRLIEATAKTRTGRLVRELQTRLPRTALRVDAAGEAREIEIGLLRAGDRVRVRPGERIAADGRIVEGRAVIQEADFTGEFEPRSCGPGDPVIAGTVNGEQGIVIEAVRVGEDILLRRMIELVERARDASAPWERAAARAARVFVPAVLALAAAAGLGWLAAAGPAKAGFVALAVLVVACPCAMGLATPLATALALGRAARSGVLVRGGDVMERLASVDVVFFDKTGTLTTGAPTLGRVELAHAPVSEEELLGCLATLESASEHPLARAALAEAARRGIEIGELADLRIAPGQGLRGRVRWRGVEREILAGTERYVQMGLGETPESASGASAGAETAVVVAWQGEIRGRLWLSDRVREGAAETVRALQAAGVRTVLLSGDRLETARAIGERVGITEIRAPCGPDEKIEIIRSAAGRGLTAAMVGDGINDAPALAVAAVGIALGAGTDLARQSGNVLLLSDRLARIAWLLALSRRTRQTIRQNLLWAFGYNGIALAAAAAGVLHPLLAAAAMALSSVAVLRNSLRLARFPDEAPKR